jgi:hypothetical protein
MIAHESEELMAVEKYRLLVDLWKSENRNKTNQLLVLMATNSLLVLAFFLAERTPWVALVGSLFSFVWILSLGHTISLQDHWRAQMEILRKRGAQYALFQIHSARTRSSILGRVPSRYYVLGTPIAAAISWLAVLVYTLLT